MKPYFPDFLRRLKFAICISRLVNNCSVMVFFSFSVISEPFDISLDKKGSWIDLTKELPANKIVENFQMQFQDGVLGGTVRVIADGMDSYSVRRHYHSFDTEDEWIQDTEEDEGIKVTKMSFDGADQYAGRSVINYDFESDQTLGADHLYINLFLSKYHPETAFRSETRTLPVEFPYCHQITYRGAFMIVLLKIQ